MPRKTEPPHRKPSSPPVQAKPTNSSVSPVLPQRLTPTPGTIRQLQQVVGNRAVGQWLEQQTRSESAHAPIQGKFIRSEQDPSLFIDDETNETYRFVRRSQNKKQLCLERVKDGFRLWILVETMMPPMKRKVTEEITKRQVKGKRNPWTKKYSMRTVTDVKRTVENYESKSRKGIRLGNDPYIPPDSNPLEEIYMRDEFREDWDEKKDSGNDNPIVQDPINQIPGMGNYVPLSNQKRRNPWIDEVPDETPTSFTKGDDSFYPGDLPIKKAKETRKTGGTKKRKKGGKDRTVYAPKLSTALTINLILIPIAQGKPFSWHTLFMGSEGIDVGEDEIQELRYAPEELIVGEVMMGSKDRPDTQFGVDQEAHTVAWTGARQATLGFKGHTVIDLLKLCYGQFEDLQKLQLIPEAEILIKNVKLLDLNTMAKASLPVGNWESFCANLLTLYTQAYQMSKGATFSKGKKNQRGEKEGREILLKCEQELRRNQPISSSLEAVITGAGNLLEITFQNALSKEGLAFAVDHWIKVLSQIAPMVMQQHGDEIVKPVLERSSGKKGKSVKGWMTTYNYKNATPDFSEVKAPQNFITKGGIDSYSFTNSLDTSLKSDFTARVETVPMEKGEEKEQEIGIGKQPILSIPFHFYSGNQMVVKTIFVSDKDRPKTKFGSAQKSHTVAWTLMRESMMGMRGNSIETVLNLLKGDFENLSGHFASDISKGQELVNEALTRIMIFESSTLQVHEWDALLNHLFRAYAIAYNKSTSATHVTSEGHGEATGKAEGYHMPLLRHAEYKLKKDGNLPYEPNRVVKSATRLIDVSLNVTLPPKSYARAVADWLIALQRAFPTLMKVGGVLIASEVLDRNLGKKHKITDKDKNEIEVETVRALMEALHPDVIPN